MNPKKLLPAGGFWINLIASTVLIAACTGPGRVDPRDPGAGSLSQGNSETERLNRWLDDRYEEELLMSPMTLTELGRKTLYDRIDDLSEAAEQKKLEWRARTVEDLKAGFDYSALTAEGKISYDLWVHRYQGWLEMAPYRRHEYMFTQQNDWHGYLPNFLINMHKVDSVEDMQAYIQRIHGISRAIEQLLVRAKFAAEAGIRPPRFAYEDVISVSGKLLEGRPFDAASPDDAPLWHDAQVKIAALLEAGQANPMQADTLREGVQGALIESFQPAYRALITWMTADMVNAGKETRGVSSLPHGKAYYQASLKRVTDTDMSPGIIHNIGLSEVHRIRGEMESIKNKVGYTGSLQDFFTFILYFTPP